ncbi:MAG: hypothetical protein JKY37_17945 [Nannocystaceae bacterium]|nr:hypothetical protein [Nannocystaceae bacterium]
MERQPTYRGSLCKGVLETIRKESAVAAKVLDRAPGYAIEAIDECHGLSWVRAEFLDTLNSAYIDVVGHKAFVAFWRRYPATAVGVPLLGPLFRGALRIFATEPSGLFTWVGRAWHVTTRDYGFFECERSPNAAVLTMRELPTSCPLDQVCSATQGSLLGLLDLAGCDGDVEVNDSRLQRHGVVMFRATWRAAAAEANSSTG